jgi:hypothetical protein
MQAFLLIDLSEKATYEQPVLAWVRQQFPGIPTFDLDARSDEMLQQYALRLLQETAETVVCVKAGEGNLNQLMPLLEELLQPNPQRQLLLLGEQPRLLRMLQARSAVRYSLLASEAELQDYLLSLA